MEVVSHTTPATLPPGKTLRYALDRKRGGHQSWSRLCGEVNNSLPLPETERQARCPSLYQLTCPESLEATVKTKLFS
jgi:hypothetical protein